MMFEGCGEQFRRRYGARFNWHDKEEIIPPNSAIITGISTHRSIEKNLQTAIDTGDNLSLEEVKEIAFAEASGLWQKEVSLSDSESENIEKTKGESIDMAVALSSLHATELAPMLKPKSVERKWVIDLKNYPYDLAGTIDIEEYNGDNSASIIRDTKTAGKTPNQDTANNSEQLSMYALAMKVVDGKMPEKIFLDSLVKLKTPKLVIQETTRNDFQLKVLMRRIECAISAIEKGIFIPARSDDWRCSPAWCGYWTTCKFGGKQ